MSNLYLAQFSGVPSLVAPNRVEQFKSCLDSLAKSEELAEVQAAVRSADEDFWNTLPRLRPYVVKDGILQVPVKGVLLHDFPYTFYGMATGYEYIEAAIARGVADDNVDGIALVIDSPGGMVSGNFDLVDRIYESRSEKPIRAFATEHAYSAAYSIASAADSITVPRTGGVGSIGVVTMHIDASRMMEAEGIKITYIHAGKHKVDGNPYEPLSDEAKDRIQSRIDGTYDIFVATVARNRGLSENEVRATEALTFSAAEALSTKLADEIGSLADGLAAFAATLNTAQGGTVMSKEKEKETAAVDQATIDSARAEGVAEGTTAGAQAERERISGIMSLDEAANRREAAFNIALESDLTVDQAKTLLAKLPEDVKAEEAPASAKGKTFEDAMDETGNPDLGASAPAPQPSEADSILADYRATGGAAAKAS